MEGVLDIGAPCVLRDLGLLAERARAVGVNVMRLSFKEI
jgi:hypothetical protein